VVSARNRPTATSACTARWLRVGASSPSRARIADLAAVRHDYEGPWVAWNLVRTLLSTGALVALVSALGRTDGALRRR
jgi:hypothetical protein